MEVELFLSTSWISHSMTVNYSSINNRLSREYLSKADKLLTQDKAGR